MVHRKAWRVHYIREAPERANNNFTKMIDNFFSREKKYIIHMEIIIQNTYSARQAQAYNLYIHIRTGIQHFPWTLR